MPSFRGMSGPSPERVCPANGPADRMGLPMGLPKRSPMSHCARGPYLTDGEISLRPPRRSEVAVYAGWWADPVVQWGFCQEGRSAPEMADALEELGGEAASIGHWLDLVIEWRGTPVGYVWLHRWDLEARECELNILLGESGTRGQGIGRRAIRCVCAWAFPTMELERISLHPREDHWPAAQCYRAAGAHEGGIDPVPVEWQGNPVFFREFFFRRADFVEPEALQ